MKTLNKKIIENFIKEKSKEKDFAIKYEYHKDDNSYIVEVLDEIITVIQNTNDIKETYNVNNDTKLIIKSIENCLEEFNIIANEIYDEDQ